MRSDIKAVMAKVFRMKVEEIPDAAAAGTLAPWTSLKHVELILHIERKFGVRFEDEMVGTLLNLDIIEKAVAAAKKA
ncbi:MAG: acyl carrier protein [Planctomycetota bacterium]